MNNIPAEPGELGDGLTAAEDEPGEQTVDGAVADEDTDAGDANVDDEGSTITFARPAPGRSKGVSIRPATAGIAGVLPHYSFALNAATRRQMGDLSKVLPTLNIPDPLAGIRNIDMLGGARVDGLLSALATSGVLKDLQPWATQPPWGEIGKLIADNAALNPAVRLADQISPPALTGLQRAFTANLMAVLTGPSAVTGWREALATQVKVNGISQLALAHAITQQRSALDGTLANIRGLSSIASRNVDTLTRWTDIATRYDTLPLAAAPLSAFRRYVDRFGDDLDERRMAISALASYGIGGAAASQVLLLDDGDADDSQMLVIEEIAEEVTSELITPWRAAQISTAEELRDKLAQLDPTIPDMLDGAWVELDRPGPGQLEKLSQCANEAVSRTLRVIAPDDDVRAWITKTGLRPTRTVVLFSSNNRLTRQARIRFITRNRTGDRKLLENQETALSALVAQLVERFNAGKHASAGAIAQGKALLAQLEALLAQLLLDD